MANGLLGTLPPAQPNFRLCDYTGKWTEAVAISDNGPSDHNYFRLAVILPQAVANTNGVSIFRQMEFVVFV